MNQIAKLFFENPGKEFYLRQISRLAKIPKTTVSRRIALLLEEKIIKKAEAEPYSRFIADTESPAYIFYKKQFILEKIFKSGIIEYIADKTHPKAIILFGSCAKGEYTKDSDIDLFVQSPETELSLKRFRLSHGINIIFSDSLQKISENLRNNIINGVILYGLIRL
ncbi:MAG: nucleotidyltransferase domain-containing protein [Candidatus Woesearchaeota archaeon]